MASVGRQIFIGPFPISWVGVQRGTSQAFTRPIVGSPGCVCRMTAGRWARTGAEPVAQQDLQDFRASDTERGLWARGGF